MESDKTMPIAIVGMACRLPGPATDPEALFKMCAKQESGWAPLSARFDEEAWYHPDTNRLGSVSIAFDISWSKNAA